MSNNQISACDNCLLRILVWRDRSPDKPIALTIPRPGTLPHNQALIALARRRCDVLFAMMRDGTLYPPAAS
ncbi:TPA: hypothetical protein ACJGSF_005475 [Salmonella enterica subsp. enterica serovar Muenchen]|uniref:hypothetical protein n=1 Tax=Salmonella sp. SG203 TaxID=2555397 RepID=UPI0015828BF4|nr:hypothetical protein [Salmonella sp. SG203]HAF5680808.1 hypothetical protein [Salmonella enterica]HEC7608514.1 hypothetical protein [Salmonella enterica subsp. enterica serovar Muenchen]